MHSLFFIGLSQLGGGNDGLAVVSRINIKEFSGFFMTNLKPNLSSFLQKKGRFFVLRPFFCIFALTMPQELSQIRERQRTDLREPPRYKVTIHNDDFTPMDFVVKVLMQVFFKQPAEAEQLMLQVHHSDKAVVGIYTYDIAVSKVRKATMMARKEGFPLRLTYEPD